MSEKTAQRIKQKLKNISDTNKIPFNHLLDTLFLERFLVRISASEYKDSLIFKGGMCLAQIINLGRETKDIDFLMRETTLNIKTIEKIFSEISVISNSDSFVFSAPKVDILSLQHKKYPGYRITIAGFLAKIRNTVVIDVGVGDVVRPRLLDMELMHSNGPLFEEKISLQSYPPEYIFSEKLEAILFLGEINSRMKDFYDCWQLLNQEVLNNQKLKQAIVETLNNRGTKIDAVNDDIDVHDQKWQRFLTSNKLTSILFSDVVSAINNKLKELSLI